MNTKKLNSVKKSTKTDPKSNSKTKTPANEPSIPIMVTFALMLKNIVRTIFIIPIKFYKWAISPLLPMACRHVPTCSEYAMEAIMVHGIFKGSWLAARRIARCHPWGTHGYDPVPKKKVEVKKLKID